MGGPALLPGAIPPPKQRRSFPWTQAILPVPKPARTFPRRRGQGDPFGDIVAGVHNMIQNISQGTCSLALRNTASCLDVTHTPDSLFYIAHAGPKYDLVLSSGFLAFAAHSGFLKAVEEVSVQTLVCWARKIKHESLTIYTVAVQGSCGQHRWHIKWSHIRQSLCSRLLS